MTGDKIALYLFCLAKAEGFGEVPGPGPDETDRPFARAYGDLTAVLSEVRVDDFSGPDAERKLEDPGWISERAMQHERTVEQAFRYGPVLPARFGTLFSSSRVLERFLETNRRTILDFLESIRGQEEWGVKALLDRATARKWLVAEIAKGVADDTAVSPGLRYVRERRAQAAAEKELHRWVANICDSAAHTICESVTDWRQRKILDDRGAGDPRETVLNLAALIRRDRVEDLLGRVECINAERAAQGISLVLTGPWPPYSFCPPLRTGP